MRKMFLNGTAMCGGPDHHAIRGATFVGERSTAPRYRFIAIGGRFPGLFPVETEGSSIVGELYEISEEILFGSLLPVEPRELEIGTIELFDGEIVNSMQLQPERVDANEEITDITVFGGWRAFQAHLLCNRTVGSLLGRTSA